MDEDPLNDWCDACGAAPAEACRPGCLGLAAAQDEAERISAEQDARMRDTSDASYEKK